MSNGPLTPAQRGAMGGKHRWANPKYRKWARLDALTTEEKAAVLALIAAAERRAGKE